MQHIYRVLWALHQYRRWKEFQSDQQSAHTGGPVLSPLPAGPVTSLVADPKNFADPKNSHTFYAAFTSPTTKDLAGVYVTHNSGASWTPVFTKDTQVTGGTYGNVINGTADQLVLKLATAQNGSVAIAVIDASNQTLKGLYLQNQGGSWSALGVPPALSFSSCPNNCGTPSGVTHFAVAIDPKNTSIVYVAGWDTNQRPPPGSRFPGRRTKLHQPDLPAV